MQSPANPAPPTAPVERWDNQSRVFFMHIPKTAGTSLIAELHAAFPDDETIDHIESTTWVNSATDLKHKYRVVSGHVRISQIAEAIDLTDYYRISMIREPFAHLASHLAWVRSVADDITSSFYAAHNSQIQRIATRLQTVDFSEPGELVEYRNSLSQEELELFDNCQTRYLLAGPHKGRIDARQHKRSLGTLREINLIGVTEQYDAFADQVFRYLQRHRPPPAGPRNVHGERYGLDLASAASRNALAGLVSFDLKLYDYVTTKLVGSADD